MVNDVERLLIWKVGVLGVLVRFEGRGSAVEGCERVQRARTTGAWRMLALS
jgi:hypothetical protein